MGIIYLLFLGLIYFCVLNALVVARKYIYLRYTDPNCADRKFKLIMFEIRK